MSKFHPIDRDIDFLLPPSVQEWLPEGHLSRYVVEVVEGLDLGDLERAYAGKGSAAYHPAQLLSLLIYGYATGCYSSRKSGCHEQNLLSVGPCMILILSQPPPHRSARITGPHRYYGWLRLPRTMARVLAFYTFSRVPASGGPMLGSPRLPCTRTVKLDMASDPGEYPHRSPIRDTGCCLTEGQTRRHSPTIKFSGLNTFKVGFTRYPYTSPAFCLRICTSVTGRTARLDTVPVASDYPGGIPTH